MDSEKLLRATNTASAKLKKMSFQSAVGSTVRETGVPYNLIAGELAKRRGGKAKKRILEVEPPKPVDGVLFDCILGGELGYGRD